MKQVARIMRVRSPRRRSDADCDGGGVSIGDGFERRAADSGPNTLRHRLDFACGCVGHEDNELGSSSPLDYRSPVSSRATKSSGTVRFAAVLGSVTQIRCVIVPARVGEKLRARGKTSVRARILGIEFDSTLTPARPEGHRLSVPSTVWKPRGLAIGETIPVELWRVAPAPVLLPPELERLARATPALREAYFAITPSDRRQVEKHLATIVSQDARERWISRLASKLLSPRVRPRKRSAQD